MNVNSAAKIDKLTAAILAVVLSPVALVLGITLFGDKDRENFIPAAVGQLAERQERFDKRPTTLFRSVKDCTSQGFSTEQCKEAYDAAQSINDSRFTSVRYESQSDCLSKHDTCPEVERKVRRHHGKFPINVWDTVTTYDPPMVAWQSAQGNITRVVPLYAGKTPDTAVRSDGKEFKLNS